MHLLDDIALLLGRIFLAALFLPSGVQKLSNFSGMTSLLSHQGLPNPQTLTLLAICVEIAGSVALILGVASRLTAVLLILFVAAATVTSHLYWLEPSAALQAAQKIEFFKNVAIAGGLLFYFASGPGVLALEKTPPMHH